MLIRLWGTRVKDLTRRLVPLLQQKQSPGRFTSLVILHACILSCVCRDQAMPSAVTSYYTRQVFRLCLVSEDYFISRIGVHFKHKHRFRMLPCLVGNTNPSIRPVPPKRHRLMTYPKSRKGATLSYTFSKVNWDPVGMCIGISKSYQENQIYQSNEERNSFTWVS